jgi:hypothetical protein
VRRRRGKGGVLMIHDLGGEDDLRGGGEGGAD